MAVVNPLSTLAQDDRILVLCSGGLDSTTLLAAAVDVVGADNVVGLSIFYGQKHEREMEAARQVAKHFGISLHTLNLASIFADSNCALLATSTKEIPRDSYAEQLAGAESPLVSTYVPFRNGLFLSSAASMALTYDCNYLAYGAHHDDWAEAAYPDCSQAFVDAMAAAISEGTAGELKLVAPFVSWSKAQIVEAGLALGVPYELTWSCYEGAEVPCGTCATCIDRARAFELNGALDPLQ